MMPRREIPLLCLLVVLLAAGGASAQSNPQELADENRAAMDAYNNLDIETAKKTLEEAAKNAEKNNVRGPALARTYANLGIIYVGGLSDNAAGLDAFVKALKEDPNVEPDPLVSTPEIQQVYTLAKRKAGVGGGGGKAPPPAQGPVEGNLEHEPPTEQLSQTAVPVYVKAGDLPVASMKVFYRSLGMPQPKSAELKKMGDGWGVLIPCTDVFEPNVEYFIVALDDEGAQVGNAGTPQNPVSVPIVTERSTPPAALPGEAPPSQCSGDEECPPGMPGCKGNGGLGDTCRQDKDCGEGLYCSDNFCATGERSDDDDDGDDSGEKKPRLYIDVTGGVGLAYVGQGMQADAAPPQSVAKAACNVAYGNPANTPGPNCVTSDMSPDLKKAQKYTEDRGWSCDVIASPDGGITLKNCTVAIQTPGFVPTPILNVAIGYYITDRFSLGVTGRIQFGSGEGSLAGIFAGVRGEYLLTAPVAKGFHTGLLFGVGGGRIQAQPPAQTKGAEGPYVTSGPLGVQLGMRLGYRFTRNFGVVLSPAANFMLPAFLFDLDLAGGVQVAF
jgi:hypothetical protein